MREHRQAASITVSPTTRMGAPARSPSCARAGARRRERKSSEENPRSPDEEHHILSSCNWSSRVAGLRVLFLPIPAAELTRLEKLYLDLRSLAVDGAVDQRWRPVLASRQFEWIDDGPLACTATRSAPISRSSTWNWQSGCSFPFAKIKAHLLVGGDRTITRGGNT